MASVPNGNGGGRSIEYTMKPFSDSESSGHKTNSAERNKNNFLNQVYSVKTGNKRKFKQLIFDYTIDFCQ